eukprot:495564-Pleurochrysis_carterae.AAC.1
MRASRLSNQPESDKGVIVDVEVGGSVLTHAAAAGARRVSAAGIGVPGPNGRSSACRPLSGTYGK